MPNFRRVPNSYWLHTADNYKGSFFDHHGNSRSSYLRMNILQMRRWNMNENQIDVFNHYSMPVYRGVFLHGVEPSPSKRAVKEVRSCNAPPQVHYQDIHGYHTWFIVFQGLLSFIEQRTKWKLNHPLNTSLFRLHFIKAHGYTGREKLALTKLEGLILQATQLLHSWPGRRA